MSRPPGGARERTTVNVAQHPHLDRTRVLARHFPDGDSLLPSQRSRRLRLRRSITGDIPGSSYVTRFIGGAIHFPSNASGFGQ
jgi:hypothetical protein